MSDTRRLATVLGLQEDASQDEVSRRAREVWQLVQVAAPDVAEQAAVPAVAEPRPAPKPHRVRRMLARIVKSPVLLTLLVLIAVGAGVLVAALDLPGLRKSDAAEDTAVLEPVPVDAGLITQLTARIESNPSDVDSLRQLGDAYFAAGNWDSASTCYSQFLRNGVRDAAVQGRLGTALFNQGRIDEARAAWLEAIALSPGDPFLHYALAHAYATARPPDLASARREWTTVLDLAADSEIGRAAQARLDALAAK